MNDILSRLDKIEALAALAAKNVLSVSDVAQLTGRSVKTIRNRLDEIPHYNGPMGVCFDRGEIESWMKAVKCQPAETIYHQL